MSAQVGADVVHLRDGGVVRGTVVEHLPGDHVTVLLVTGEVRTLPADRVDRVVMGGVRSTETAGGLSSPRAGSISARRPAPEEDFFGDELPEEPVETRRAGTVRVRVHSRGNSRLSLWRIAASSSGSFTTSRGDSGSVGFDHFEPLCASPCELELEPGLIDLGIARGEERPVRPSHSRLDLQADTELTLEYVDRGGLRIAGWVVFALGFPIGAAAIVTGLLLFGGLPLLISGAILALFSLVFWLVAAFHWDHIDIRRDPLGTVRF